MRLEPVTIAGVARKLVNDVTSRDPSVASLGKPSLAVVGLMVAAIAVELLADIALSLRARVHDDATPTVTLPLESPPTALPEAQQTHSRRRARSA